MANTNSPDVVDVLVKDHREIETMFAELETGAGEPEHRKRLCDVVIAELVRHAVAEEMYLYPTAREALPDGDRIADQEIGEHAAAEKLMGDVDDLDATDPGFDSAVAALVESVRHHVRGQESGLFPRLRHACRHEDLLDLARRVEAVKKIAPTRPSARPVNRLVTPGAGLVDRVRDALTNRATKPSDL